ncbi:MAG: hypothetical protein ABSE73_26925 [Planctomycetota bacterium]
MSTVSASKAGLVKQWDALLREAWGLFAKCQSTPYLVTPSIPILYFGDYPRYCLSSPKVITVGLNPSLAEFPTAKPFQRFPAAEHICTVKPSPEDLKKYSTALNNYFEVHPFAKWFGSFEPLLNGLGCSYYNDKGQPNRALHTDLCSPLATRPTWSKLKESERESLVRTGKPLWHKLVECLSPHIILISVRQSYRDEHIELAFKGNWQPFHTVTKKKDGNSRKEPYVVETRDIEIRDKPALLVFGQAANTPLGTISGEEKRNVGRKLKEVLYAHNHR